MLKFAVILHGEDALDLLAAFTTHQAEVLLDKVKLPISMFIFFFFLNPKSD
jgi:hypothetical protein